MGNNTLDIVEQLRMDEQNGLLQSNNEKFLSDYKEIIKDDKINHRSVNDWLDSLINISNKSNIAILITDHQGNIAYINELFCTLSGYSLSDIKGRTIKAIQANNTVNPFFPFDSKESRIQTIQTGEIEFIRKNDDRFWQKTTIIPLIKDEMITHYLMLNEDITNHKEMQQNLKIKENAILSSINAIVLTDLSGKIDYVNPSFLKMWSIDTEKKVLNKPVFSLWKQGGKYVHIMDTVLKKGGWLGEVIAQDFSGRLFPVQMSASMVTDDQNKPLSIMASFVDISKQKRLEKNYKKFKKISDASDYGSVIFDLQGNIVYGNNAFAKMHNYTMDELIGNNFSMLFSPDQQEFFQQMLSRLKEDGKIIGQEQWHLTKDGTSIPLLVTSTIINDEQFHQPFVAGTMIDITKMKEAEQKIIQNAEEVKQVNQELNVARDQLALLNQNLEKKVQERTAEIKKLLKQKDNFIHQLGHDLRTPLTPMFALLPLLENQVCTEKGKEYLALIHKNSRYMRDLVNKTITYAKINTDNIEFSFDNLNIHEFAHDILSDMYSSTNENGFEFDNLIDKKFIVRADPIQLKEVFQNLISNAIKYKKENSNIHLTIDAKEKNDSIILSIKDNGIGMTEEQISNIFDEFYKADQARSNIDSHGLGLNICKRIIEKHHGLIWAESDGFGKGSTFYFTLTNAKHAQENIKNEERD